MHDYLEARERPRVERILDETISRTLFEIEEALSFSFLSCPSSPVY